MKATTVRTRPLRRATLDEYGVERENATGPCVEVWVRGSLHAIARIGENAQIIWATEWGASKVGAIEAMLEAQVVLMETAPETERV